MPIYDFELEILILERQAFERAVKRIRDQQLGEAFRDLPIVEAPPITEEPSDGN